MLTKSLDLKWHTKAVGKRGSSRRLVRCMVEEDVYHSEKKLPEQSHDILGFNLCWNAFPANTRAHLPVSASSGASARVSEFYVREAFK